jgi:hypothetical protein
MHAQDTLVLIRQSVKLSLIGIHLNTYALYGGWDDLSSCVIANT